MQNNSWNYGNVFNQDGEILVGASGSNPTASFFTSSAQTIAYTFSPGAIDIETNSAAPFFNPLPVVNGGSGQASLILSGVLIGEGSNSLDVTAAGTNGQLLIAGNGMDPAFATITSTGNTITFKIGYNSLNLEANVRNNTFFNPLLVVNGGTGRTLLTAFGVLIGEGQNNIDAIAAGTRGQVLIASSTGDPKFVTITSTGNTLTFTTGPNSLNLNVNFANTFFNPLQVPNGGTGKTVLTGFGVLVGEGSNRVNVTAAGTNGQLLIASSTGDPKFARLSSSGGAFTFRFSYNAFNIDIAFASNPFWNPLQVANGGTGKTVLTGFGVLVGEGSNRVNVTAAGTNGQILIASSTGDPKFARFTSTGGSFTFAFGSNSLNINIDIAFASNPFWNPLQVLNGGTGKTVLTAYGVLVGEGSKGVNVTAAGTNGQILIASSTGDPKFATITSSNSSVTFTFGYNTLNADISFASSAFFNPLQINYGGTGKTILTAYGVLIGEGSKGVNVTAAGTNGQTLIASSTGDPKFMTITSSGASITFVFGYSSLNMDVSLSSSMFLNPLAVNNGGTGLTVLTVYGVLIGEGSNDVNVTAAGTNGQTLIASSTGDPQFATITSDSATLSFAFGYNTLNIQATTLAGVPYPILATNGATGRTILTSYGVLIGEGSNPVNAVAGTNGQVLIASSTDDPQFAMISSSGGAVAFTTGYNTLNIDVSLTGNLVPLPEDGGTGQTILTTYGVLIGEGSNDINVTAAGTNGQVLIASSTGDPQFATITSSGGAFTFAFGYNTLNLEFVEIGVDDVDEGGTGRTVLTTYGVLIGEGSNNVNVTAAGTNGQVLIASSTGDPQFSTISSSGGSFAFAFGYNTLNMEFSFVGLNPVRSGGTGETVLTTYGVLIGEGSNTVNVTAPGTNGQVLIASSTGDPQFVTITSSAGSITFAFGANSLNMEGVKGALVTSTIAGGTGLTVLTTYGVLVGEGSKNVNVTAAGTNGQILVASSTGDPAFFTISSTKGSIAFSYGYNSLNMDLSFPVEPSFGGTGQTILTTYGVLIGEGSNSIDVTDPGTNGQILLAGNGQDPQFATITSTGGSIVFAAGPNSLNMEALINTRLEPVKGGGTGLTLLTTRGVLIGEGSNNINVTPPGTRGQVLIASSTGDPKFSTITSSGGTVTFTSGSNSLNMEVISTSQINPVKGGGTGQTVLTKFGVLVGEGSNGINAIANGTRGQVLIAASTSDPAFSTITSSGGTLAFQVGPNSLNIDLVGILSLTFGGTGRTVLTTFGVLIGEGSNNINVTAAGTNGQTLIASSTGDPKFARLTSSGGSLTFSVGSNSLNIEYVVTSNIIPVKQGGTGQTVLTNHGVLIGEGSNNINVTPAGTDGQLLVASSTGDPRFATVASVGNTLAFTSGANSLNVDVNSALTVAFGGTGRTVLTTFGVLIGEGSLSLRATNPGTNGQLLIASSSGDPKFTTITSSGGSITFIFGSNSLNMEINSSAVIEPVSGGGTGRTILTTHGVLIGEGSLSVHVTAVGTNGQILIASSSGDPKFATITSTGNTFTFSFGPNSLNIDFSNILLLASGGTSRTVFTTFGVLLGEGSLSVRATNPGTNGQLLIASTTGDPKFAAITSTGGTITFTSGSNSLNMEIVIGSQLDPIVGGGTGRTVLTTFGVLIGEGSNSIHVTAAGTNGQVLIAGNAVDPKFATITSTGNSLTFAFGVNSLNVDLGTPYTFLNPWPTVNGGTGLTVLTAFGVLVGEGSNDIQSIDAGTNGQLFLAATGANPKFSSLTSTGSSFAFTSGVDSLNIDINGGLDPNFGATGQTVLTAFGVLIGEGSNPIDITAAGTNGQVLIARTNGDPKFSTISSTANTFTFTSGANSLNFDLNLSVISADIPYLIKSVTGNSASSLVQSVSTSFNYYLVDTTNGTVTLQFPETSTTGKSWVVKDLSGATDINPIIIATASGTMTFDGQSTFTLLNPFGALQIMYNALTSPSHYELF